MTDIKMRHCPDQDPDEDQAGDFTFLHDGQPDKPRTFLRFVCPRNPERHCGVFVHPSPGVPHSHVWEWDGNVESPTLSPSIHCGPNSHPGCGWHGFVRDGVLKEC
jgi:hypothetical protein